MRVNAHQHSWMVRLSSSGAIAVLLLMISACQPKAPQVGEPADQKRAVLGKSSVQSEQSIAAGELIIKLTDQAGARVRYTEDRSVDPYSTGLDWLDALNRQHGVVSMIPVFHSETNLDVIRQRFPERAKRAPQSAQEPNIAHTYKLILGPDKDVVSAGRTYERYEGIEYAQANYIAEIYDIP